MNAKSNLAGIFRATSSINAESNSDILYGFRMTQTFTIGANSPVTVYGYDYNPTISGTPTNHYAMRLVTGSLMLGASIGALSTALNIKQAGQLSSNGIRVEDSASTNGFSLYYTSSTSFRLAPDGTTDMLLGHIASSTGNSSIFAGRTITLSTFNNSSFGAITFTTGANYTSTAASDFTKFTPGYDISSGTATHTVFASRPMFNFTGTYVGLVIGYDYNPTTTSMTGVSHYAALFRRGLVGIGLGTPTALLDLAGSTVDNASLRIRSGVAPTSPNDGDIWFDGTDLKIRVAGVTYTLTKT
jgi:hypothetical protein